MPTRLEDMPLCCKLNDLYTATPAGRWAKVIRSKKAKKLQEECLEWINHKLGGTPTPYENDCYLSIQWYNATRHRHDIDGIIKQLLDILTKARIIEDDSLIKSMSVELLEPRKPGGITLEVGEL